MSNRRSTIRLLAAGVAAGLAVGLLAAPPAHADLADVDLRADFDVLLDGASYSLAGSGESALGGAGDFNGDGVDDVVIGAPDSISNDRSLSGSTFVVFGGMSGVVDLATLGGHGLRIDGAADHDLSGGAVGGAGDVNGDGYDDVVIGAVGAGNNDRHWSGSSYVVFGGQGGWVDLANLGDRGFRIDGAAALDQSGLSVAGAGDVNGDGYDDVVIGASEASNNSRLLSGSSYVVFGSADTTGIDLAYLGDRGYRIDGAAAFDLSGSDVRGSGDVNGDGYADVLLDAPVAEVSESSGSSYVVFGSPDTESLDLARLGTRGFRIDRPRRSVHSQLDVAGDVNRDGYDDVLIQLDGGTYVVFGSASAGNIDLARLGERGYCIDCVSADDSSRDSVGGAGDINGDGYDDTLVGATISRRNGRGSSARTYVVFGGTEAPPPLANLGNRGFRIDSARFEDDAKSNVGDAGDVNDDGYADFLISVPGDMGYDSDVYVVFGHPAATLKVKASKKTNKIHRTGRTKLVRSIRVGKGQKARVTVKVLPKKARKTVTVKKTKHRVVVRTRKTPKSARIRVRIASRGPGYLTKTWSRTWRMVGAAKPTPTTQAQSPLLLALGDSWAGGFGDRKWSGYVNRLHDDLRTQSICPGRGQSSRPVKCDALEVRNISRGNATTTSVLSDQLQEAVDLLRQRNGDEDPTNDVVVTAVTVGGLDVFQPVLQACVGGVNDACRQTIDTVFSSYRANIDQILAAVRAAAGKGTKIVVTAYGNPIPYCYVGGFGLGPLGAAVLEGDPSLGVPVGLNDITRSVAANYDVGVAETFGPLGSDDWVGGTDCVHPDASGHEKVAGAFLKALGLKATGPGHVRTLKPVVKNGKVRLTWKKARRAKRYEVRITQPGGTTYLKWTKQKKRVYVRTVVKGKKYRAQIRGLGVGGRGPITTVTFRNG